MCKFWWHNLKTNKGIHWCSWKALCIPKAQGGFNFKELAYFNKALFFAKQGWKLITSHTSLLTQVIKAKYSLRSEFLKAELGANPSFT